MTRHKLDVQKRQHRERSQPLNRQKLGLLEKHSDYIKRAKDYNSKKDRIKKLLLKASLKNHDEFYFKMINSKIFNGLHFNLKNNDSALSNQLVKLLKTQDFNFVKTCRSVEEKKIIRLQERLGSMVTNINSTEKSSYNEEEINLEILNLINESIAATGAKSSTNPNDPSSSNHQIDSEKSLKTGKKILFVDSVEEVKNFDPSSLLGKKKKQKNSITKLTTTTPSTTKKSKKSQVFAEEEEEDISDREEQLRNDQETYKKRLIRELKSRLSRLRVLQTAERELELKKSLMGKGSKFHKFDDQSKTPKLKGLINNRDLSWYDKLDRNQLIEEDEIQRQKSLESNKGIKTGAKVWKWKQERKK